MAGKGGFGLTLLKGEQSVKIDLPNTELGSVPMPSWASCDSRGRNQTVCLLSLGAFAERHELFEHELAALHLQDVQRLRCQQA